MLMRNLTASLLGLAACWPTNSPPAGPSQEPDAVVAERHYEEGSATAGDDAHPIAIDAAERRTMAVAINDVASDDVAKHDAMPSNDAIPSGDADAIDNDDSVATADAEAIVIVDNDIAPGSWRTTEYATVLAEPRPTATALGTIAPGSRLARRALAKDRACPRGWLAVEPRGFVCGSVVADRRQPDDTLLPAVPRGAVIPGTYAKVRSVVFDSVEAARKGDGRASEAKLTVRRLGTVEIDGKRFWRTRHGLVSASSVQQYRGSRFHGVDLREDDVALPLAWTVRREDRFSVPLLAEPSSDATVVRRIGPKRTLPVLALTDDEDFANVGPDTWIARDDIRIARVTEPPEGLADDERWLDIDLDEQTLVAYEGTTPVYATLVSSGKVLHRTPTGVFRIERKVAERTMNSMLDSSEEYSVDKVPWTAYFAHGYALHAAYWHSGFGQTRSHGCINLAPIDARHLYAWTAPAVAPGWFESYGHAEQPGSVVRIRNAKDPEPKWKGYAAKLREITAP